MTAAAAILFSLALAMLIWSYLVYPALARRLAAGASARAASAPAPSSVEVLVSAANEEAVIGDRVTNLLAQEFRGRYGIAVGCDGCSDRTAQRASAFADMASGRQADLRVLPFASRRGKAAVLNDLVATSQAEVLVFTDANTRFDAGAVTRLAEAFRDAEVGAACGRLVLEAGDAESAFWDRETRLKEAEGRLGVCLGANGAIYAARRSQVEPLPTDTTSMDDFLIPLRVARGGGRVVFVGDAVAHESAARRARAEMARRFRIGVGAGQVLRRERWLWNFSRRPRLSLAFLSRKVARWLAPVAALAAFAAAVASTTLRPIGLVSSLIAVLLVLSTLIVGRPRGLPGKLYYFGVINLALSVGVIAGLFGYSRPIWKPVPR